MSDVLKGMISCVSVCAMAALLLYDDYRLEHKQDDEVTRLKAAVRAQVHFRYSVELREVQP